MSSEAPLDREVVVSARDGAGDVAVSGPEVAGDGHPGTSPLGALTPIAALVLVLVAALALREVASLLVPVLFGLFIALVAWPVVGRLERRGARHSVAVSVAMLVVLAIVLGAVLIIAISIGELVVQVPRYEDRLRSQISALRDLLGQLGIATDTGAITAIISPEMLTSFVRPVASAVSGAGVGLFVLAFTMIYALYGGAALRARAEAAFGERHALLAGAERFGTELRRYLLVRAQLGIFAAVLSFVLLLAIGVPLPALWSFLVFAASFIPNIGTFIAVIPPTVMAFLSGGPLTAVIVVIGYTLINLAQDQFLQPVVMGNELNLSPLVVFLSVLAWAWILGAGGALLAVPLTVGLVMILEASPTTRGISALMRNKVEAPPGPEADAGTTGSTPAG